MLKSLDVSATALEAERVRIQVIANNLANVHTTRARVGKDGRFEPYRRRLTTFVSSGATSRALGGRPEPRSPAHFRNLRMLDQGVRVSTIVEDQAAFREVWEPGHPDADENGKLRLPNVDPVLEMVDMMEASRAYEANLTAIEVTKSLAQATSRVVLG